jgi:hypothetical protein
MKEGREGGREEERKEGRKEVTGAYMFMNLEAV